MWRIRGVYEDFDLLDVYKHYPNPFTLKIHHGGLFTKRPRRQYTQARKYKKQGSTSCKKRLLLEWTGIEEYRPEVDEPFIDKEDEPVKEACLGKGPIVEDDSKDSNYMEEEMVEVGVNMTNFSSIIDWDIEWLGIQMTELEGPRKEKLREVRNEHQDIKGIIPVIANVFPSAEYRRTHDWLNEIPPHTWSRSNFIGRAHSDVVLNNMREVFNRQLIDGRDKPIIMCLEYIREYLMKRIVNVKKVIEKSEGILTPTSTKLMDEVESQASGYTVLWSEGLKYQVNGHTAGTMCCKFY
ncbi:hypothetical protein OSB04_000751 [Centaurea solstitialis]|uniref:Uncharacterized protein n=1 Tax=Centaurea solstitialis TaxID=347529 RepID=A0AA38WS98_9ASTR|nr:hypothetical protein OSB04_000751 [Centaurea solstitialis]